MASNTFGIILSKIDLIREVSQCDLIVQAVYEHKRHLIDKRGNNDKVASRSITAKWKEYSKTLNRGETGKKFCPYCGRHVTVRKFTKYFYSKAETPALHNGRDIVVRACCLQCHHELVQRYEKEAAWLQQQQTELTHMQTIAKAASREVLKLLKRESRRATNSPVS